MCLMQTNICYCETNYNVKDSTLFFWLDFRFFPYPRAQALEGMACSVQRWGLTQLLCVCLCLYTHLLLACFICCCHLFWFWISTKTQNKKRLHPEHIKQTTTSAVIDSGHNTEFEAKYWLYLLRTLPCFFFFSKSVTYNTQSSDKEQMVISHAVYMFWWQVISWNTAGHDVVNRWLAESQLVMTLSTGDWLNHGHDFVDRRLAESHLVMTLSTGDWLNHGHDFVDRRLAESQLVMTLSAGDWLNRSWWWLCWQAIGWNVVRLCSQALQLLLFNWGSLHVNIIHYCYWLQSLLLNWIIYFFTSVLRWPVADRTWRDKNLIANTLTSSFQMTERAPWPPWAPDTAVAVWRTGPVPRHIAHC